MKALQRGHARTVLAPHVWQNGALCATLAEATVVMMCPFSQITACS
jgi:hypothetical protein